MAVLLRELQSVEREQIGFSSTLSTIRSDEDTMVTYPTSPWVLSKRDVIYQVQCTLDDQQLSIEIDAKTFEFSCRGPVSELAGTLVHCVHQAWDMKMVVQHSSNLNLSPAHRLMGQVVTNSLHVRTTANGEYIFELLNAKEDWTVTSVRIRHTGQYRSSQTPGSVLSVVAYQTLRPSEAKHQRRRWTIPKDASRHGPHPEAWFEAHISCSTLDALLEGNVHLSLGGQLSWDTTLQDDVCDALFAPALETIAQIDEVGGMNDNGLSGGKLHFQDSVAEARERSGKPEEVYW
ncbi:hypothetical protein E4U19_004110 [Claviceps sp. Clav32 group G5]|nr:hypothetical protein E4U19_004110 [Claviceps sp. Clav32 group G5]KAG6046548.1 hypothetical protein E4U39_001236 [Claviceps sp. Clav50 group G5]